MADTPAPASSGESKFGFLGKKLGPFPVVVWGGLAVGGYLLARHFGWFGLGQSTATPATQAQVIEVRGQRGARGFRGKAGKTGKRGPRGFRGFRGLLPVDGGPRSQPATAPAPPVQAEAVPVASPSGQGPVYDAWTSPEQPDIQRAYAPMTNGAVYGS